MNAIRTNGRQTREAKATSEGVMQESLKKVGSTKSVVLAAAAAAGLLSAARPAGAALVTLQDGNSLVKLNTLSDPNPDPANQDGMYNWSVDGTNQLRQQWFWYRTGNTGAGHRLNSLAQSSAPTVLDTNGDGKNDYVSLNYQGNGFTVNVQYLLTGGTNGSGASDISETIKIKNTTNAPLPFSFAHYADYNLGGTGLHDSVVMTGGNTAKQTDARGDLAETVFSPKPSEYSAGTYSALRTGLDSGSAFPLNGSTASYNTDAAYATEWDKTIPAHGTEVIGADEQVSAIASVPEPTSAAAFFGAGGLLLMRTRRRDNDPDPRSAQVAGA